MLVMMYFDPNYYMATLYLLAVVPADIVPARGFPPFQQILFPPVRGVPAFPNDLWTPLAVVPVDIVPARGFPPSAQMICGRRLLIRLLKLH